jgi:hypothetical protein
VHRKLLPIIFGVVFALTLFFAVAAGAQEERTITDGVSTQVIAVQQQQVPNDQQQQQVVAVQQQQVEIQAQGCRDPRRVDDFEDDRDQRTRFFDIDTDIFRLEYTTERIRNNESARVDVQILDNDNRDTGDGFEALNGADGAENINEGPGDFRLDIDVQNARYDITVFECRDNDSNNNRHNRHNRHNRNNDRNTTNIIDETVDVTRDTTTPRTTPDTNTANAALDTTTADDANLNADFANRPDSGSFRCDLFLRTVRDDQGALRAQYSDGRGDDEEIVQRFEQCLSEDVLADTIPDRNLPFTGGPLLPFGGGLVLFLVAAAVLAGRMIRR